MSNALVQSVGFLAGAVVVLASGVWLTRAGWPFGTGLLTVHKLVALAAAVALGVLVYRSSRSGGFEALDWAIVIAAGVLTIASFASGGVVSAVESPPSWALWTHRLVTWIATVSLVGLYLRTL